LKFGHVMKPLIFSHIPKTAGTSLRVALSKQMGRRHVFNDYGYDEPTTSNLVKQCIYEQNDFYELVKRQPAAIIGHFPVKKYIHLSSAPQVITFVREPSQRVISEYKHHIRHANYAGSLLEFAKLPQNKNKMHRYLRGVPWSLLGFIGVCERYDESLILLNKQFNFDIAHNALNKSPEHQLVDVYASQKDVLKRLNHLDYKLYECAVTSFEWRIKLDSAKQAYVHGGWAYNKKEGLLLGFAFYTGSDDKVELMVKVNKTHSISVIANQYNEEISHFHEVRCGYIGFSVSLEIEDLNDIECCVAHTGQTLPCL
jgi:hypothetical protein